MRSIKKQQAIGLMEVLVTILITTVGLVGLTAMQMQSIRTVSDSGNRTQAVWVVNDLINRIRANEVAVASYITPNEQRCNDVPGGLKMCAAYAKNGAPVAPAADCTNQELAAFDIWDALCGTSAITGEQNLTGSASFINTAGLEITDIGGGDYQIDISWNARTSGQTTGGNSVYFLEKEETAAVQRDSYSMVFRP